MPASTSHHPRRRIRREIANQATSSVTNIAPATIMAIQKMESLENHQPALPATSNTTHKAYPRIMRTCSRVEFDRVITSLSLSHRSMWKQGVWLSSEVSSSDVAAKPIPSCVSTSPAGPALMRYVLEDVTAEAPWRGGADDKMDTMTCRAGSRSLARWRS